MTVYLALPAIPGILLGVLATGIIGPPVTPARQFVRVVTGAISGAITAGLLGLAAWLVIA